MPDIHHTGEHLGRPVGLVEISIYRAIRVDISLISVDNIEVAVGMQKLNYLGERFGEQLVVVIEHCHEFAPCNGKRSVGCRRNSLVRLTSVYTDSIVEGWALGENFLSVEGA